MTDNVYLNKQNGLQCQLRQTKGFKIKINEGLIIPIQMNKMADNVQCTYIQIKKKAENVISK